MDHKAEDIKSLMIEKLDKHISPEDELLLERLISEEQQVQAMWAEMQQLFATGDGKGLMEQLDTQREWEVLRHELKKEKKKRRAIYISLAATVAAAAVAGLILYINQPAAPTQKTIADRKPAKAILLQIGNNKAIDLSDNDNEAIVAGEAHLHNNGKVLTLQGGNSTQWSTITVPTGMDYQVKLSDNSILWLNAATTAHFPVNFTREVREIEIRGEAYLQVAKDASRPFIVHLPGADVQVLGTSFNINSYDSGIVKVALIEGSVNMRTAAQTVGLEPGYQAQVSDGALIRVGTFDERQVLSWMKGQYVFSNTPVSEIAKTLQRWYDITVVTDNDAVSRKCFTGVINKQKKLQDFLNDLTETAEVNYYFKDGVLHFK